MVYWSAIQPAYIELPFCKELLLLTGVAFGQNVIMWSNIQNKTKSVYKHSQMNPSDRQSETEVSAWD
ncbi:hypothetical protein Hjap01_01222 [Haloarcula japonica]